MFTISNEKDLTQVVEYLKDVPYEVSRSRLYDAAELYDGFVPCDEDSFTSCYDTRVYQHFVSKGKQTEDVMELLARTLHDHGIHVALNDFFHQHDPRKCVGVMGGHALLRTDAMFREIVLLSKRLTELGFCMLTGGGPGAMEATHLGAWMAGRSGEETGDAVKMLADAPSFKDKGWLATAFNVMEKYPQHKFHSLGMPTWLYGHEPSTPFATHIAKFFENSIREDSILTLAYAGIVYTPGSAGTMQEIFQDAVQNHYLSFGFSSPMVFLGKDFWINEMPVYPLLEGLVSTGKYKNLILSLTDSLDEVVDALLKFQSGKKE
ncbi:MAG: hypothetical protein J5548_06940 [Prevotella sp.]|nr:hypothetical protein [Prevotella sp.]